MKKESSADLDDRAIAPVYLFYGDEFLVKEQVQRLVDRVLDPQLRSANFVVLGGANPDLSGLSSDLLTPSLFGGSRVVLVEQSTLFMGAVDRDKLVEKLTASWKSNDRKGAFRVFGQLLTLLGLDADDVSGGSEWITEILGQAGDSNVAEALLSISRAFIESGAKAHSATDEALVEELLHTPFADDTVLIFTAPAVDRRKKLFKALEKRGKVVECTVREERFGTGPDRAFLEERVRGVLNAAGKEITGEALEKIYARAGKDIRRLHGELEKLIGYAGARKEITAADVEALFADFHEAAFYEINSALRSGNLAKCVPALHENLKIVSHPLQTLGAIANDFRRLMVAREMLFTIFKPHWKPAITYQQFVPVAKRVRDEYSGLLPAKSKHNILSMKDYPLYLYLKDAQKFTMERLVGIMEAILEADIMMKSTRVGSSSPRIVMENLVLKICNPIPQGAGSIRK